MHPNEFDKALRDRYESGSLPPDLAQWEQLASRLDVYESAAAPPSAPAPRRRILTFWPVLAAAASILLIGWLFLQRSEDPPVAGRASVAPANVPDPGLQPELPQTPGAISPLPQAPAVPRTNPAAGRPRILARAAEPRAAETRRIPGEMPDKTTQPVAGNLPAAPASDEHPAPREVQPQPSIAAVQPQRSLNFTDEPDIVEERRRLGLDLNGGYGPGSLKRNYAVGVSVHRSLSRRLQVEAGVAVVSGTYEAFDRAMSAAFTPGVQAAPQNSSTRLTYLQAAPGLTYELVPGLFAGAGVDAQRLLTNSQEATGFAYTGDQLEAQPSWDFGYTVRAGYKLNRHIKAGLQYRNSMRVTAPTEGTAAQPRNYLLFQLGYSVF